MKLIELITRSQALTTEATEDFWAGMPNHALDKLVRLRELLNAQPELLADGALPTSEPRKETD